MPLAHIKLSFIAITQAIPWVSSKISARALLISSSNHSKAWPRKASSTPSFLGSAKVRVCAARVCMCAGIVMAYDSYHRVDRHCASLLSDTPIFNPFHSTLFLHAPDTNNLIGNTMDGTLGAASKITGAVGHGLSSLTFDGRYKHDRARRRAQEAQTVTEGIRQGGRELGSGFYEGMTGVVLAPVRGAERAGVVGFGKGLVKGASVWTFLHDLSAFMRPRACGPFTI